MFKELKLGSHLMQHATKCKLRRHGLTVAVVKGGLWGGINRMKAENSAVSNVVYIGFEKNIFEAKT